MMRVRFLTCLLPLACAFGAPLSGADEPKSLVEPRAKVKKLAGDMKFTEGPVWVAADKKLIFSDIPNSKLMQWKEGDGLSVYRASEQANGNILDL
ncbi:MAG: SMP-30/gluconolactonase/LRE family protein, partial [Gemmata sp.]